MRIHVTNEDVLWWNRFLEDMEKETSHLSKLKGLIVAVKISNSWEVALLHTVNFTLHLMVPNYRKVLSFWQLLCHYQRAAEKPSTILSLGPQRQQTYNLSKP